MAFPDKNDLFAFATPVEFASFFPDLLSGGAIEKSLNHHVIGLNYTEKL